MREFRGRNGSELDENILYKIMKELITIYVKPKNFWHTQFNHCWIVLVNVLVLFMMLLQNTTD